MSKFKVRLDHKGVVEFLKSPDVTSAISGLTSEIAAGAAAQSRMVVETKMETTDRARGVVAVRGKNVSALVARDGLLINQAKGAGLDFKSHAQKTARQKRKRKGELAREQKRAAQE